MVILEFLSDVFCHSYVSSPMVGPSSSQESREDRIDKQDLAGVILPQADTKERPSCNECKDEVGFRMPPSYRTMPTFRKLFKRH